MSEQGQVITKAQRLGAKEGEAERRSNGYIESSVQTSTMLIAVLPTRKKEGEVYVHLNLPQSLSESDILVLRVQ